MQEAENALRLVKLDVPLREKVRRLSTSQHQLISIARACQRVPKILILDEPTSALTETEVDNLFHIIQELKRKGISCLYISHKMEEIMRIADRISVLRDGRLISTRRVEDVTKGQIIEDMVGRKIEALFPKEHAKIGKTILRVENFRIPHPQNPNKYLLEDISFSLCRGEVLGLGGLVGSGRSELLDALFGIHGDGFSGRMYIDEKPVRIANPQQAQALRMGYLTEDRRRTGYVGTMDVAKNITLANLGALLRGIFLSLRREAVTARHYIQTLSIRTPSERTSILKLSGGNQQKTVLAKWLNRESALLLLDEPTRGIDVGAKAEIYQLISRLAQEGVAIVLVTSEMPELIAMSDRIIVLAGGAIRAEFTKEQVSQQKIMEAATKAAG
jgi:ABC-type sugar transport system ATPase subunit